MRCANASCRAASPWRARSLQQCQSIGDLARELDLSRSGLFAHFATKESLQLGVLEQAAEMFVHEVIEPGRAPAVGDARVRLLFTKWLAWSRARRA